jgi:hypothetical protein
LSDNDIVEAVSFVVVEQLLLWISSLDEEDRNINLEALRGCLENRV